MFNNTVTLTDGAEPFDLSITDTDNGTTTRSINLGGGNRLSLVIARSDSKENPGILSDRILVRIDSIKTEPTTPYAPAKLSAYLVLVVPQRPDVLATDVYECVAQLVNFIINDEANVILTIDVQTTLARLLAGET